jgi:hypothetical protein
MTISPDATSPPGTTEILFPVDLDRIARVIGIERDGGYPHWPGW